jgi:hypothetical protein
MVPTTGNVYMVTTPEGNVIIDTAASDLAAEAKTLLAAQSQGVLFLKTDNKWSWASRLYKGGGQNRKLIRKWSDKDFPKNGEPEWDKED